MTLFTEAAPIEKVKRLMNELNALQEKLELAKGQVFVKAKEILGNEARLKVWDSAGIIIVLPIPTDNVELNLDFVHPSARNTLIKLFEASDIKFSVTKGKIIVSLPY